MEFRIADTFIDRLARLTAEILVPVYAQTEWPRSKSAMTAKPLVAARTDDELLSYGVPPDDTERHLWYVACTRARDYLRVTSVEPDNPLYRKPIMESNLP
jgi:hypothetical protein